jgi:hypothetical protein
MADLVYVLLAFLALGVGTLLWAIHEFRRELLDDQDDDTRNG